jgi:hypothetical protein
LHPGVRLLMGRHGAGPPQLGTLAPRGPPPGCSIRTALWVRVRLVHEPTITDRVAAGPGRVGQQRCEALHPPIHRDVIDLDPTLGQEFLDVAIRQAEPQIPTYRQDNHLRRESEALERRARDHGYRTSMRSEDPTTVALGQRGSPLQQSRKNEPGVMASPTLVTVARVESLDRVERASQVALDATHRSPVQSARRHGSQHNGPAAVRRSWCAIA